MNPGKIEACLGDIFYEYKTHFSAFKIEDLITIKSPDTHKSINCYLLLLHMKLSIYLHSQQSTVNVTLFSLCMGHLIPAGCTLVQYAFYPLQNSNATLHKFSRLYKKPTTCKQCPKHGEKKRKETVFRLADSDLKIENYYLFLTCIHDMILHD
jgi:hypothetical protein